MSILLSPQKFPWRASLLTNTWKWRIKLSPGEDILKSLEFFVENNNGINIGFAEFRFLGSVWADSVQYAISEEFGKVNPIAPYGFTFIDSTKSSKELYLLSNLQLKTGNEYFTEEQKEIAKKARALSDKKRDLINKKELTEEEKYILKEELPLSDQKKRKKLEVLFGYGTISWTKDNKAKAHAHISFAESGKGNAFGGHLLHAEVSIVAEVILDVLTTKNDILGSENWDITSDKSDYFTN